MDERQRLRTDIAAHYEQLGLSSTSARVLGHLVLEPTGQSDAPTLAQQLRVAKSSMSVALATLERYGLISRIRGTGSRRESIVLSDDAFESVFLSKLPALAAFLELAERGLRITPAASDAARRLSRMRDFYAYMMREFPRLLEGWQREIEDAAGASRN
jgi:DNA-binding MarR family transcriptional regulator